MKPAYKAAFLIPCNSKKTLSEDGWIIESPMRLSKSIADTICKKLKLAFKESYENCTIYEGHEIKATVIHDEKGEIEQIYLQLFRKDTETLKEALSNTTPDEVEIFIP
ncbi:hypothetical protein [Metapseudomonas resinovorans]|uniref:Uncharacterized protein n=1 Tax=Metapseudomonas resinovorans NBRC 106553 TaxID=1245471 RepID=S6AC20_METRE|nr:hypothetical protein [Pseudomonas resinovorans]BAN46027.1 hypothetical protein PCA10_02950 [Pseudomonas resinovorans NBRC 106553]